MRYRKQVRWEPTRRAASTQALSVVLVLSLAVAGALVRTDRAGAVDLPPVSSPLFLQTSGPNAGIGIGDWYSSPSPGGGIDHLFELEIPLNWPAGTSVTVALYDPELETPDPASPTAIDEIRGTPDDATFILEAPNGTPLATVTYTPTGGTNAQWTELLTFDPATYGTGTYHLRTTVSDDDDNSWRLALYHDPDCTVTGTPGSCAPGSLSSGNETDNPDSLPGTGDELTIGIQRASYQHGGTGQTCQRFFFFVAPGTTSITLHNFDMDSNGSVTYNSPSGSSFVGSVSGEAVWNNSPTANRVGDTYAVGPSDVGWWSTDACISPGNQYIFEGINGTSVFLELTLAVPQMTLAKSDGLTLVSRGDDVTYVMTYANASNTTATPGLATNVTMSDTLPAGTTFVSCSIDAPGSCSESGGVITFTITNSVLPGNGGSVETTVHVGSGASATITNTATLTYDDPLGNTYPSQTATDVDNVAANAVPTATDDAYNTPQNTTLTVTVPGVLTNDTDPDGNTLTVQSNTTPANGTVTVNTDGSLSYTPNAGYTGADTFDYTITDGSGGTATATVTITVTPIGATNIGPVATDDSYSTAKDTLLTVAAPGVLANDTDADGNTLTVQSNTTPANGTVTVNTDGSLSYTPNAGYTGADTFDYTITDGNGGTATATVTISVTLANRPPEFTSDPTNTSQTVNAGESLAPLTGSDPDGDAYTFAYASGVLPPGVSLNADGMFSGSPTDGGTYVATIDICDIYGLCTATVLTIVVHAVLPFTGAPIGELASLGLLMTLFGGFLVLASRRRHPRAH